MAGSQITLTMSLIFIALFSIAIFGFAIGFANDNDAVMSITDDPDISSFYTDNKADLSTYGSDAEGTYASIIDTTVEPGSDVAQSTGPFAASVGNLYNIGKNIISIPYKKIFGSGEGFGVFFTIFGAVIVFLFALFLYKTLRGNP